MAVDNQMVKQIAFLSKLKIEDDKLEETKDEFNKILAWVEELKEVQALAIKIIQEDPKLELEKNKKLNALVYEKFTSKEELVM